MRKNKKRLAALLTAALVLGLLPAAAMAEEGAESNYREDAFWADAVDVTDYYSFTGALEDDGVAMIDIVGEVLVPEEASIHVSKPVRIHDGGGSLTLGADAVLTSDVAQGRFWYRDMANTWNLTAETCETFLLWYHEDTDRCYRVLYGTQPDQETIDELLTSTEHGVLSTAVFSGGDVTLNADLEPDQFHVMGAENQLAISSGCSLAPRFGFTAQGGAVQMVTGPEEFEAALAALENESISDIWVTGGEYGTGDAEYIETVGGYVPEGYVFSPLRKADGNGSAELGNEVDDVYIVYKKVTSQEELVAAEADPNVGAICIAADFEISGEVETAKPIEIGGTDEGHYTLTVAEGGKFVSDAPFQRFGHAGCGRVGLGSFDAMAEAGVQFLLTQDEDGTHREFYGSLNDAVTALTGGQTSWTTASLVGDVTLAQDAAASGMLFVYGSLYVMDGVSLSANDLRVSGTTTVCGSAEPNAVYGDGPFAHYIGIGGEMWQTMEAMTESRTLYDPTPTLSADQLAAWSYQGWNLDVEKDGVKTTLYAEVSVLTPEMMDRLLEYAANGYQVILDNRTPGWIAVTPGHGGGSSGSPSSSGSTGTGDVPEGSGKKFADTEGHWAEDAINFVTAQGLFAGTGEDTFTPDGSMTRAMAMTVLAGLDGSDTSGGSVWYEKSLEWAVDNGISDGSAPDADVTREQLVQMLYRYAQNAGLDVRVGEDTDILSYTDAGDISEYAVPAMQWACGAGLISGMGDGTLAPQGNVTRAQVAVILMQFCRQMAQ